MTKVIRCYFQDQVTKRLFSVLFTLSCSLKLSLWIEASCHVASCMYIKNSMRKGTEGGLWPTANKEPNLANNHMSEPGSGSFSNQHLDCSQGKTLSCTQILDPPKLRDNKSVMLAICYTCNPQLISYVRGKRCE